VVGGGRRAVVVAGPDADVGAVPPAGGGSTVVVERWLPDGARLSPGKRLAQLAAASDAGGGVVEVAVDVWDLDAREAVAGPVVAWGGVGSG
jgi:hypothetical protein